MTLLETNAPKIDEEYEVILFPDILTMVPVIFSLDILKWFVLVLRISLICRTELVGQHVFSRC